MCAVAGWRAATSRASARDSLPAPAGKSADRHAGRVGILVSEQDVESARTLEIDALLGSVLELARLTDTPTPHLDAVYALTKLLGKTLEEGKAS